MTPNRHWAAGEPRAAVIFLHGFGEHTGVYHRYGFALTAVGIDLWAHRATSKATSTSRSS